MAVPVTRIDPGQTSGDLLSASFGQGLGTILEGLASGKVKELQGRQFEKMGLPAQLAYLDPKVQSSALKQLFAAQQFSQNQPQIQDALGKLQELEDQGDIGERSVFNPLRYLEGKKTPDTDLANVTAQQLKKILPKGEYVPPNYAKMEPQARQEYLAQLQAKYGAPQQQQQQMMGGQQQMQQQTQQPQEQQPQGQEMSGPLGGMLRTLGGAAMQAPAAILNKIPGIGGPLSGAVIGSDLLQALEPSHLPEDTPEHRAAVERLTPGQREEYEAIKKTAQEKGSPSDYFPSTRNIKKLVGAIIPDNLITPRSKGEKVIADAVSKGMNLMSFGKMGFPKALAATAAGIGIGKPLGEYISKKTVGEDSKWSPLINNTTELLFTMAPSILWNRAREVVGKQSNLLYNKFDSSAASYQQANVKDVYEKSKALRKDAATFGSLKSNKNLIKTLEDFEEQAVTGKMPLRDAVKAKRELYRAIKDTNLDKTAAGKLKNLTSDLRKTILKEGERVSKEGAAGFEYLKKADEIRTGLANSETIVDKLRAAVKGGKPKSIYLRSLVGRYPEATVAGVAAQGAGVPFAKVAVPIAAGKELQQIYKFYRDTPGAWDELQKIALNEIKGNTKAAVARVVALDKKALKHEKKQSRFLTRR